MSRMMKNNQNQNNRAFRFVVPKKGRLQEKFAAFMETTGLELQKENDHLDYGYLTDNKARIEPVETLVQRAGDALKNLNDGFADMAVVGLDSYEKLYGADGPVKLTITHRFNDCSACAMWIATPDDRPVFTPQDLAGMRIATSYPRALESWLRKNDVKGVQIITREGGIEDYIRLGAADAVCDIVETGGTMEANGLVKRMKLFDSTAILVERTGMNEEQQTAARQLRERLQGNATYQPAAKTLSAEKIPVAAYA